LAAISTLGLVGAFVVLFVLSAWQNFPRGLIADGLIVLAVIAAWLGAQRRGVLRGVWLSVAVLLLAGSLVVVFVGHYLFEQLVLVGVLVLIVVTARRAFDASADLPAAVPPSRPIVVWNPKSGGGKAAKVGLEREARSRGIEPIELHQGDDLVQLVNGAVAGGADGLAAAGGDGTQALVATIAAEHDLPFACIPAGTRNHFALDLGVDRDDVVGSLDAFVNGGERRVDLAEVNGRVFVNNASLGLYAEAVQRHGYRKAKLRSILDTAPDVLGDQQGDVRPLHWTDPEGQQHESAAVILVSNNEYRLGHVMGSGTRPGIENGVLGIAVMSSPRGASGSVKPSWQQWTATEFIIESDGPVPIGIDGEALVMDPPLHFRVRPAALRARIAPQHRGASPSADLPDGAPDFFASLFKIATKPTRRT
jgi:hypothetical protein